jgi:hypothetical protein
MLKSHPLATLLAGFIPGLKKRYAGTTLMLDGKPYLESDLEVLFKSCIDDTDAADAATVAKVTAVKKAHDTAAMVRPVAVAFKKAVYAAFGGDPSALADFSLEPPKAPVKTAATKQAAAVKAKATREALGTKGPKQKKLAKKQLASGSAQPQPAAAPATEAPAPAPAAPAQSPAAGGQTPSKS